MLELIAVDADAGKLWWKERARHWFETDREWREWNARYAGKEPLTEVQKGG
jgi:hypothetical protein